MSTKSKKKSKKKTGLSPLLAIIIAIAVVIGGVAVVNTINSPKRQIRATISEFETAYNNMDLDRMVSCCEPRVQSLYSGANSLFGSFAGVDFSTLSSLLPFISDDYKETAPKVEIDIKRIEFTDKTNAVVTCDINYVGDYEEEEELNMVKIDDHWYIAVDSLL